MECSVEVELVVAERKYTCLQKVIKGFNFLCRSETCRNVYSRKEESCSFNGIETLAGRVMIDG